MEKFSWVLISDLANPKHGYIYTSLNGTDHRVSARVKIGTRPRSKILLKHMKEEFLPSLKHGRSCVHQKPTDGIVLEGVGTFDETSKKFKMLTSKEIAMGFSLSEGVKIVEVKSTEPTPAPVIPEVDIELAVQTTAKEYVPEEFWFHEDPDIIKPIKMAVKHKLNVLLKGDTGCGKTTVVKYLAAKSKNGHRRVNLNGETTVDDLVGKYKLNKEREMVWIDGVLTECMRKGLWFCCDEVNAALPEVKFVLHSALDDDRYIVLTQKDGEIVKAHPDFRFFGTMNESYAGTHTLNRAFEDRFGIAVRCLYPTKANEVKIILKKTEHPNKDTVDKMVTLANKCRMMFKKEEISTPFSTRRLLDWAVADQVFGTLEAFRVTCLNKMPTEEHVAVLDVADAVFPGMEFRKKLV